MTISVFDLASGKTVAIYSGITSREAVIAAYAQSLGDWSTWDYAAKYNAQVREGQRTVGIGDFCAFKEQWQS